VALNLGNLDDAANLESVLHREIPLAQAMQLHVAKLVPGQIRLEAPVEEANVNIHGTAFAGSIYSISTLAAWGLTYHSLQVAGIKADIVLAEGNIRYKRPVMGDIIAETSFSRQELDTFMRTLNQKGKAVLTAVVEVSDKTAVRAINKLKLVAVKS
jgi:thioesterase domain-containing protein